MEKNVMDENSSKGEFPVLLSGFDPDSSMMVPKLELSPSPAFRECNPVFAPPALWLESLPVKKEPLSDGL